MTVNRNIPALVAPEMTGTHWVRVDMANPIRWFWRLHAHSLLLLTLISISTVQAQPVVNTGGVLNAASYAITGLQNSDIAQGSMFVVFGQRLGPAALQQAQSFPLPTQLAGTSIRVTGGGVSADAIMIYTSAGQVAAILPSRIPPGEATITLTYNNQPSAPVRMRVGRSSLGIFTRNQAGSGPGIVQNYVSATDQPVNALTEVARPGQVMILWGTGLGPVDFDESRPPEVRNLDVDLDVLVAGKSARVLYKGRSPQFPGIDQINFEIPADTPEGCHVPLALRAGGVVSNFATISVASSGRVCSDAIGPSAADMEKLRSTGQLRTGGLVLSKTTVKDLNGVLDELGASFDRYDHETALKARTVGNQVMEYSRPPLPLGTCIVGSGRAGASDLSIAEGSPRPEPLYPGALLNWQGPRGLKQTQASGASVGGGVPGLTGDFGPEYLVPGVYTVDNGAGSPMVGPFRATLTMPAPLEWTNRESLAVVRRSQDLTVTWNGGDSSKEYVVVGAASYDTTQEVGAIITCMERASAGRFTIPSWLLSTLPASGIFPGTSLPKGNVYLGSSSILEPTRFQAQGLDVGLFGYQLTSFKFASVQ
jgi:uncharacterized protein (TIGR03437 family)